MTFVSYGMGCYFRNFRVIEMDELIIAWAKFSDFEYDVPVAGAVVQVPEKPTFRFEDQRKSYDQSKTDPSGCTWYAAMTCIANNRGIDRDAEDFEYMRTMAPSYWRVEGEGMYLSRAGDMVVDYLNKQYPDQAWVKRTVSVNTQETDDLRSKWWMIHMWSYINQSYNSQIKLGAIVEFWGKTGIGHSRSLMASLATYLPYIEENYDGVLPYNTIEIQCRPELKENQQLYNQWFIYFPSWKMPIEITVPYMNEAEASAIENSNPSLYEWLTETVRTWVVYAQQGMSLWYKNYRGLVGVSKMVIDIDKYREKM